MNDICPINACPRRKGTGIGRSSRSQVPFNPLGVCTCNFSFQHCIAAHVAPDHRTSSETHSSARIPEVETRHGGLRGACTDVLRVIDWSRGKDRHILPLFLKFVSPLHICVLRLLGRRRATQILRSSTRASRAKWKKLPSRLPDDEGTSRCGKPQPKQLRSPEYELRMGPRYLNSCQGPLVRPFRKCKVSLTAHRQWYTIHHRAGDSSHQLANSGPCNCSSYASRGIVRNRSLTWTPWTHHFRQLVPSQPNQATMLTGNQTRLVREPARGSVRWPLLRRHRYAWVQQCPQNTCITRMAANSNLTARWLLLFRAMGGRRHAHGGLAYNRARESSVFGGDDVEIQAYSITKPTF